MGGPEDSLELQPGISCRCQGQASKAPPPAWPDLPSVPPSLLPPSLCLLSLEVGGGAARTFWLPGKGDFSWVWGYSGETEVISHEDF